MRTIHQKQWNRFQRQIQRKRWNHQQKYRNQRYSEYYNDSMQDIWHEEWELYLKRIIKLKKNINSLGKVPNKPSQLISTTNYFVSLINLVTNFTDNGIVFLAAKGKLDAVENFNNVIISLTAREKGSMQFWNKTPIGQNVSHNTLYLGMYSEIDPKDITPEMKITKIDGELRLVEVEPHSISDWLNKKAESVDGKYICLIKQQDLAHIDMELTSILLGVIDEVLAEEKE